MEASEKQKESSAFSGGEIADLPETCLGKIRDFERELNKQGYWNIALVAYQLKG